MICLNKNAISIYNSVNCVPAWHVCDSAPDCPDESDEKDCPQEERFSDPGEEESFK
jgi:hypothetical protein